MQQCHLPLLDILNIFSLREPSAQLPGRPPRQTARALYAIRVLVGMARQLSGFYVLFVPCSAGWLIVFSLLTTRTSLII